jgi:hypothetical protein
LEGQGVKSPEELENLQVGTRVRVQVDYREPKRRGAVGTIHKRYGVAEYIAFEVVFADGQTELFWDHQLEETKEEQSLRSKLRWGFR